MAEIKDKDALRDRISAELEHCIGRDGGKLSSDRQRLKSAYLGHGYGVDSERASLGLSTYVDRSVMEAVEWAKPGLFRIFCADEIVRFDPKTPEQEQAAADATLYVNQVVFGRNMFELVHDVLTDGLYQRVGWVIAHAPLRERRVYDQYAGLTEQEALALLMDAEQRGIDLQDVSVTQSGVFFDVSLSRVEKKREVVIEQIPSENVILSDDAQSVENARFVARWDIRTKSDLRREGYASTVIDDLPVWDENGMPETTLGQGVNSTESDGGAGRGPKRYKIFESWLDWDINGDGIDEKVMATFCGEDNPVLLKAEAWPLYRSPLFAACSVPMPHNAVGLGLADLVLDLQDLKTEMTRQYLDGLAYANTGELVVKEGAGRIEYDSLLSRKPGAVHRIAADADIIPLPVSTASSEALQGLQAAEEVTERRTGISSRTQSVQADTLQNTATGASIMEEAVNQRLELIARVYAEGFFKPLGRYVLHLVHKYQDKPLQIRMKGKFMAFDPRKWDPDMDISVAVGLGTGNRTRLVATYQQVLQIQQQLVASLGKNSPVRLPNIIYTCHKMAEAAGLEAPERFFGTEDDARKAEESIMQATDQLTPEQQATQQKLQLEAQKAQQKQQLEQAKAQAEAQRKAFESKQKATLEQQKIQGDMALKTLEMQGERDLDMTRLRMGQTGPALVNLNERRL